MIFAIWSCDSVFSSSVSVVLMKCSYFFSCILFHFTTKRQSQIIAFVSIVYVFCFFLSCSMMSITTHIWIHLLQFSVRPFYYGVAVALFSPDKYSVCLFISIGFLIYLHAVARVQSSVYTHTLVVQYTQTDWLTCRLNWTNCQVNCIKRIDNEFTAAMLRVFHVYVCCWLVVVFFSLFVVLCRV